jgi:hypothetical protein
VVRLDYITIIQVGDGASQLEHAVEGAGGEMELFQAARSRLMAAILLH